MVFFYKQCKLTIVVTTLQHKRIWNLGLGSYIGCYLIHYLWPVRQQVLQDGMEQEQPQQQQQQQRWLKRSYLIRDGQTTIRAIFFLWIFLVLIQTPHHMILNFCKEKKYMLNFLLVNIFSLVR